LVVLTNPKTNKKSTPTPMTKFRLSNSNNQEKNIFRIYRSILKLPFNFNTLHHKTKQIVSSSFVVNAATIFIVNAVASHTLKMKAVSLKLSTILLKKIKPKYKKMIPLN